MKVKITKSAFYVGPSEIISSGNCFVLRSNISTNVARARLYISNKEMWMWRPGRDTITKKI
jgi:hypothetical protein